MVFSPLKCCKQSEAKTLMKPFLIFTLHEHSHLSEWICNEALWQLAICLQLIMGLKVKEGKYYSLQWDHFRPINIQKVTELYFPGMEVI